MLDDYLDLVDGFRAGEDSLACGLCDRGPGRPVLTRDVLEEPLWDNWVHIARGSRVPWLLVVPDRDARRTLGRDLCDVLPNAA